MYGSSQPHGLQHSRFPCLPPSTRLWQSSWPLNQWCHSTTSSSVTLFFYLQSFSALGFSRVSCCRQVAKVLELQLQHQSFQSIQYWFPLRLTGVWSPYFPRDSQESYPAPQFKSINSLVLSLLYGQTLTSIYDYWKNHSFDYMDLCHKVMFAF